MARFKRGKQKEGLANLILQKRYDQDRVKANKKDLEPQKKA